MTEEEAKKKWCPFARTTWGDGSYPQASFNRWIGDEVDRPEKPVTRCIGSVCMAWRVHYAEDDGNGTEHGFCGLAGKP